MSKICYASKRFGSSTLALIDQACSIIDEYSAQGFDLTLRQLYYQFVSRDLLDNKQSEYKRLGSIINDARLAGLIDWDSIVDRTRQLRSLPHWENPGEVVRACAEQFRVDKWEDQEYRIEVWIEKDALVGVIEGVCRELDIPYFSCRGYTSQSEMWAAAQRLIGYSEGGQQTLILHLGDHDPSGLDMSRDIQNRIALFMTHHDADLLDFLRIALNRDQVDTYKPPPNPAKLTDSRSDLYIASHGTYSWELDALEPSILAQLIRTEVEALRDDYLWGAKVAVELEGRRKLRAIARDFERA